jgi:hypothetical protein
MTKDEIAANWSRNWFGFWGDSEEGTTPESLLDFVDPSWVPPDRQRLLNYIENAPCVVAASAGYAPCFLCSERMEKAAFQSDGLWLWPSHLLHYLKEHAVRLPRRMEDHIRSQNYAVRENLKVRLDQLPWPSDDK